MTDQPTRLDLDEIEARANAATPGPWCTDSWEIYQGSKYQAGAEWIGETCRAGEMDDGRADAEFVAAARTDVPALLAEVRRLRARIAELEAPEPSAEDTLPAWLARRFDPRGADWDGMSDDDRAYWAHQADAVRRAVARGGFKQPPTSQHLDELLPAWEAMYEPGNVSDYLIGYANDEAAAKGAAEAWMRSESEVTGRLEWTAQNPLDGYDREFEMVQRHDDGVDTGPGITVRRRIATAATAGSSQADVLRDFLWRLEQSAGDAAAEKFLDDNPELRELHEAAAAGVAGGPR